MEEREQGPWTRDGRGGVLDVKGAVSRREWGAAAATV